MRKVLITEEFHPILAKSLNELGFTCEQKWDYSTVDVLENIQDYEILVINSKILVNRKLIENASKLKVIIRIGSGLEIIDQDACREREIYVISTPEGNANAVAEHVLAFLLSAYTHLQRAQHELLAGNWNRESNRGEELGSKIVAVIGCGNNGSQLVNLLAGFETEVLVYDIVDVSSRFSNARAKQVEMDEIFNRADVVSFHIPLNDATDKLIRLDYLKRFNKSIDLVNTSRGGICRLDHLELALKEGYVRRAMLDVFDKEPFKISEALRNYVLQGRLFLTPHIAGWTHESKKRMAEYAISKLKKLDFL